MARKVQGVKPRRLDRRNPFNWWTCRYGYFSAFLAGGGTTTREKLLAGCMKTRTACEITTDTAGAVRKDIADHVNVWTKAKNKASYKLTVTEAADGTLTCTHISGVPWAEYMEGRVR